MIYKKGTSISLCFIHRTQNNPALSLDLLEGLLGFVQEFGASLELQQLWGTLAWESFSKKFGVPSPDIRYSSVEISGKENEEFIYYPKTDADLKDARNGYKSQIRYAYIFILQYV